jgi:hypothetical protein
LWATLVVAMGLGWWVSYQAVEAKRLEQTKRFHTVLSAAKRTLEKATGMSPIVFSGGDVSVDWRILDETRVEP